MASETHDHSRCISIFEKLSEYIDNELDTITCRDVEAHINACAPCSHCLRTLQRTIELCRQSESQPVPRTLSEKLKDLVIGLT